MGSEMKLERCVCCLGRKTLIGLGNILVKCAHCKGVGYVDTVKAHEIVDELPVEPIAKSVKRTRAKPAPKVVDEKKPYILKDI